MDLNNHPRADRDPVSRDCGHHLDRLGHRRIEAGLIPFSFGLPLFSVTLNKEPEPASRSPLVWGLMFATRTRKYGRVAGHWDFNLEVLVHYRKTFLQLNSENVRLTSFVEYLISMR